MLKTKLKKIKSKFLQLKSDKNTKAGYWSMTEGVFNCLIDEERTIAFKKAIDQTVEFGDVVVDMGTGSGILAMLAVDAGAKKVYAVEFDKNNIKTLESTFRENGCDKKIEIVEGDVTKVELPEKVDVIVGEMIATGLIEELQIPAMNNILRYAKKNVKVVLKEFENYADLVFNKDEYYGKKFKLLRYEYPEEKELISISFSKKVLYKKIDFSQYNEDVVVDYASTMEIIRDGMINGIRISSRSIFYDNSSFDASFAYSYPIILPIDTVEVKKGDVFLIELNYKMCGGFGDFNYLIKKK
jgi:predicted RNA methylase